MAAYRREDVTAVVVGGHGNGLRACLNRGSSATALYSPVVTGSMLSIIALVILFLALQRYWRTDLASGAVKQ